MPETGWAVRCCATARFYFSFVTRWNPRRDLAAAVRRRWGIYPKIGVGELGQLPHKSECFSFSIFYPNAKRGIALRQIWLPIVVPRYLHRYAGRCSRPRQVSRVEVTACANERTICTSSTAISSLPRDVRSTRLENARQCGGWRQDADASKSLVEVRPKVRLVAGHQQLRT
jgi:hypothetical protein